MRIDFKMRRIDMGRNQPFEFTLSAPEFGEIVIPATIGQMLFSTEGEAFGNIEIDVLGGAKISYWRGDFRMQAEFPMK